MNATIKSFSLAIILLMIISIGGCGVLQGNTTGVLKASGMIEATEIAIAPELGGRVIDVLVSEGDSIKAGNVLFHLDDSLLEAQHQVAEASLASAQAGVQTAQVALDAARIQYGIILSNALAAASPQRIAIWDQPKPAQFDQPAWYYTEEERYQSTQVALDAAKATLDDAQAQLADVESSAGSAQFAAVERRLSDARAAFQLARNLLDQANAASDEQYLRNAAQSIYDEAEREVEDAQKAYNDALMAEGAKDMLEARSKLAIAQERYYMAQDALRELQVGERAPEVVAAASAVEQATTAVNQAQSGVNQAQAQLDLLDLQIEKAIIYSPQDGVVMTRSIQPGEIIQAGMTALTIADLEHLTVTVYIPEDRYGEISLGDQATLSADSFPGETFVAAVARIADRAEYTPQNVQTTEGRQTTVYAVELSVINVDGKLKPGMPVDVEFAH
jgi:HlyD family secretion protein